MSTQRTSTPPIRHVGAFEPGQTAERITHAVLGTQARPTTAGRAARHPAPNMIRRDAAPDDRLSLVALLGSAFNGSPVDCWLNCWGEQPRRHDRYCIERVLLNVDMFHDVVDHAMKYGHVRVAQDTGACTETEPNLIAAALWLPAPAPAPVSAAVLQRDRDPGEKQRMDWLDTHLAARHPRTPRHDYLQYLVVTPHRDGDGIEQYLLADRHRDLDRTGTPAYTVADTVSRHDLLSDLGYSDIGAPIVLPGCGSPLWPMWREPGQDGGPR